MWLTISWNSRRYEVWWDGVCVCARRGRWEGPLQVKWTTFNLPAFSQLLLHRGLTLHQFKGVFVSDFTSWRAGSSVDCGCLSLSRDAGGCRLSTWTPRMSCGRAGIRTACSASLSPCTGSLCRRIRECCWLVPREQRP